MKPHLSFLILVAVLFGKAAIAQDANPKAVDDRQIKATFEKQLGRLKDEGKTPDPADLRKQMEKRKHHALELPRAQPLNASRGTAGVYQQRRDSVLCFGNIYKCDSCNKWHGNIAGGFVISEDGVAVTNYHVMEAAKAGAFGAMTTDGKVYQVEEILAASKADDLAIVKLAGNGFKPAPLVADTPVGSKVIAITHPQGRFYSVSEGIISRYYRQSERKGSGPERVAITADFAKGSSGSPVFSENGDVIGVVASTNSIYYDREKDGSQKNLQMVIKSCIPTRAILNLLSEAKKEKPTEKEEAPEKKAEPKSEIENKA
ncbi:MAG: serine protease Do [Verrucomicrobiales bacterium]|jgi:serine protease Do